MLFGGYGRFEQIMAMQGAVDALLRDTTLFRYDLYEVNLQEIADNPFEHDTFWTYGGDSTSVSFHVPGCTNTPPSILTVYDGDEAGVRKASLEMTYLDYTPWEDINTPKNTVKKTYEFTKVSEIADALDEDLNKYCEPYYDFYTNGNRNRDFYLEEAYNRLKDLQNKNVDKKLDGDWDGPDGDYDGPDSDVPETD